MRYFGLVYLMFSVVCSVHAQQKTAVYNQAATQFEQYYNTHKYDSVFAMFTPDMQRALPLEKTTEFLSGLEMQAGKMIHIAYETTVGQAAKYKTTFEKLVMAVFLSVTENSKISGLLIKPYVAADNNTTVRNSTKLKLPFNGEWTVFWGGDTESENYHIVSLAQKNAFDFVITNKEGKTHAGDGKNNEDYFAFGKRIIAPCHGKIVSVIDGVKDNQIGEMNKFHAGGNTIIIQTPDFQYLVFCHLQHHSIVVHEGEEVKQGQLLGFCGNTGNSSEPHLHFHIQNKEDINTATGIKCFFDKLSVNNQPLPECSPVKNDKIKNL